MAVIFKDELLFHEEIINSYDGFTEFLKKLTSLPKFKVGSALFCMEETGIFGTHVLQVLDKMKGNIVVENAYRLKHSMGLVRGKDDKIDSIRIARYVKLNADQLKLWVKQRIVITKLKSLLTTRSRLISVQVSLNNPISAKKSF